MNDPPCHPLSHTGQARRGAMLDELLGVMARTHGRRRRRRRIVAGGAAVFLVLGVLKLTWPNPAPDTSGTQLAEQHLERLAVPPERTLPERPACVTTIIRTDRTVLDRSRARATGRVVWLDDRMLLETLAMINRPAGLIRFGDQLRLSAPVTDAELSVRQ